MLSSVLRSKRAVLVNIEIMRTFVRLRLLSSSLDPGLLMCAPPRAFRHQWHSGSPSCNNSAMTRIVGRQDRPEFILDPVEAWHRGRLLDRMLAQAQPPRPRGVLRGTHAAFEQLDESRRLEAARRLNRD